MGQVNQKGGVSKSTTSVHLAYWLTKKQKRKTLLIDAEGQRSSSLWVKGMEDVEIPVEVIGSPDDLLEQIPELADDYDYAIMDGPTSLSEATSAATRKSKVKSIDRK